MIIKNVIPFMFLAYILILQVQKREFGGCQTAGKTHGLIF